MVDLFISLYTLFYFQYVKNILLSVQKFRTLFDEIRILSSYNDLL